MTIALLATGNEIICGDTLNTNCHHIAHTLHSENLQIGQHLTCSDHEEDILLSMQYLLTEHSILIITGGLGPTRDDRTRFALAKLLNCSLEIHPQAMTHLQQYFAPGFKLNEGNRQQALFPAPATLLANPYGTALGCYCLFQQKKIILLPGPPRECLPMFHHWVLPLLQKEKKATLTLLKWRLFGVAEGEISELLEAALQHQSCQTGYRLDMPYLEFKIYCPPTAVATIKEIIEPLVKPHIICSVEERASKKLLQMLLERQLFITIIDEVTGGLLQTILQKPETFHWVSFSTSALVTGNIAFKLEGLTEFWEQQPRGKLTEIKISYHYQGKSYQEQHHLMYRSAHITATATEFICFRIEAILQHLIGS